MTNSSIFKFSKTPTHQDMDSEFLEVLISKHPRVFWRFFYNTFSCLYVARFTAFFPWLAVCCCHWVHVALKSTKAQVQPHLVLRWFPQKYFRQYWKAKWFPKKKTIVKFRGYKPDFSITFLMYQIKEDLHPISWCVLRKFSKYNAKHMR